jgi:hypothetical protein
MGDLSAFRRNADTVGPPTYSGSEPDPEARHDAEPRIPVRVT